MTHEIETSCKTTVSAENSDDNGVITIKRLKKLTYMLHEGYLTVQEYNEKRLKLVDQFVLNPNCEITDDSLLDSDNHHHQHHHDGDSIIEEDQELQLSSSMDEEQQLQHTSTENGSSISDDGTPSSTDGSPATPFREKRSTLDSLKPSPILVKDPSSHSHHTEWSNNNTTPNPKDTSDSSPMFRKLFLKSSSTNNSPTLSDLVSSPVSNCPTPSRLSPEQMLIYPERNRFRLYMDHVRAFTTCKNLVHHYEASKQKCKIAVNATTGDLDSIGKLHRLRAKSKTMGFSNEYITFCIIQIHYLQNQYWKVIRKINSFLLTLEEGYENLKIVCLFMRGYCHRRIRNTKAAFNDYHAVVKHDPHFYPALGNIATIYFAIGNMNRAYEYWTRALDHQVTMKENVHYLTNRAKALVRLKRYEEALADCAQASNLEPENEEIALICEEIVESQQRQQQQQQEESESENGSPCNDFSFSNDYSHHQSNQNSPIKEEFAGRSGSSTTSHDDSLIDLSIPITDTSLVGK